MNDIVNDLLAHKWLAAMALTIAILVRLVKGDTPLPFLSPKYRPFLAVGLGLLSSVVDAVANGTPWLKAIGAGLTAAMTAIASHEMIVESARGGREFFSKTDPSTKKAIPTVIGTLALIFVLASQLVGCTKQQANQVIDTVLTGVDEACLEETSTDVVDVPALMEICKVDTSLTSYVEQFVNKLFAARAAKAAHLAAHPKRTSMIVIPLERPIGFWSFDEFSFLPSY